MRIISFSGVINLLTIPNYITFIRILLIPLYLHLFIQGDFFTAGLIFVASAFTDLIDGYIARKYNMESKFGKLLDPFADKLTIVSILFVLIKLDIIPRAVSVIILGREIFILLSGIISYFFGHNFINPTFIGKTSVFLLYTAIAFKLLDFHTIGNWLFYLVIPINIISAVDYFLKAYRKVFNK